MLQHIRLLVFDLDHLLFDCGSLKLRALRQSLAAFAEHIPQSVRLPDEADIEESFREHGSRWIRHLDLDLGGASLSDLEQVYASQEDLLLQGGVGRLYPEIPALLAACKREGLSLALGAEAARNYLLAITDRHDLDRFLDVTLCSEEFGQGGCNEMLAEVLNQSEVNPSEALILGTRPSFFEAGQSLDLLSIGCAWGIQSPDGLAQAHFQVQTVSNVLPTVRRADLISAQYAG